MRSLRSAVVAQASAADGEVHVSTQGGGRLTLVALTEHVFRLRYAPDGAPRVSRTWSVVGDLGDAPREGRERDAHSEVAKGAPAGRIATHESTVELATSAVRAEVSATPGEPLRVSWVDVRHGCTFASDRSHGAYAHDTAQAGGAVRHCMTALGGERYLGGGEASGELDKAGRRLRVATTDGMGYDARSSDPLYKHWPAYVTLTPCDGADGSMLAYGLFYDSLAQGALDLGAEISAFRGSYRTYEAASGDVDLYLLHGPTPMLVCQRLAWLTGRSHPPPRWALGYLGSTMHYTEQPDAQALLAQFASRCAGHGIPCSAFHLSSGYTADAEGRRCVVTWNAERVPDPEGMFDTFHAADIRAIPNIKPWMLTCHPEYEALAARGGFLKRADGGAGAGARPLVGRFWSGGAGVSGDGSYVDFASEAGYAWWVSRLRASLVDRGADGAWNDNNEYEVDDDWAVCGDRADAERNTHRIGVRGRALQSLLMARASRDALLASRPHERPFVISRSGCAGIQRYAQQTWTGDNYTGWAALRYNIPMGLSLSMCGWAGVGHDVGGFAGPRPGPELLLRWVQQGVLQPRFVIHSGFKGGGCNEPWMHPSVLPLIRGAILLRYRLIPLLHSLHLESYLTGSPVTRPLCCHFHSADTAAESFLYTLGASLLAASVLEPMERLRAADGAAAGADGADGADGAAAWPVALPCGATGGAWCDVASGEWHAAGTTVVCRVTLGSLPLFAAGAACIPVDLGLAPPTDPSLSLTPVDAPSVSGSVRRGLVVFAPPGYVGTFVYTWYDDDGASCAYTRGGYVVLTASVTVDGPSGPAIAVTVGARFPEGGVGHKPDYSEIALVLPPRDPRSFTSDTARLEWT